MRKQIQIAFPFRRILFHYLLARYEERYFLYGIDEPRVILPPIPCSKYTTGYYFAGV